MTDIKRRISKIEDAVSIGKLPQIKGNSSYGMRVMELYKRELRNVEKNYWKHTSIPTYKEKGIFSSTDWLQLGDVVFSDLGVGQNSTII